MKYSETSKELSMFKDYFNDKKSKLLYNYFITEIEKIRKDIISSFTYNSSKKLYICNHKKVNQYYGRISLMNKPIVDVDLRSYSVLDNYFLIGVTITSDFELDKTISLDFKSFKTKTTKEKTTLSRFGRSLEGNTLVDTSKGYKTYSQINYNNFELSYSFNPTNVFNGELPTKVNDFYTGEPCHIDNTYPTTYGYVIDEKYVRYRPSSLKIGYQGTRSFTIKQLKDDDKNSQIVNRYPREVASILKSIGNSSIDIGFMLDNIKNINYSIYNIYISPKHKYLKIYVTNEKVKELLRTSKVHWGPGCGKFLLLNKSDIPKYTPRTDMYTKFSNIYFNPGKDLKRNISLGLKSPTNMLSENKPYTFGVEIETCGGSINPVYSDELNMKTSRDMSINLYPETNDRENAGTGAEYVTGVLRGDAGFAHLQKIVNIIGENCMINKSCSIHVHIGNTYFNKTEIVLMYKALLDLEDELFTIVPPSRGNNNPYARKMKRFRGFENKLKKLYKISKEERDILILKEFNNIFSLIGYNIGRYACSDINRVARHPSGSRLGYDRATPRYWWVNFLPTLFNCKGENIAIYDNNEVLEHNANDLRPFIDAVVDNVANFNAKKKKVKYKNRLDTQTVEFRIHGASMNYGKIRNFILLCMGIVHMVHNEKEFICNNKLTISNVLLKSYPKKGKLLNNYFEERKVFFKNNKEEVEYSKAQNPKITKLSDVSNYL